MPGQRPEKRPRSNLAVAYLRTSSAAQDMENSQDRQAYHAEQVARKNNLQIVRVFSDLGTGLDSHTRHGYMDGLEFARDRTNNISTIIVDDMSRLSRDTYLPPVLLNQLRREGIAVFSRQEGLINAKDKTAYVLMQSYQNNETSRATSVLTKGGLRTILLRGFNPMTPPYGYSKEVVKEGKETHYIWVPNPEEAEAVQKAFNMYDQGHRIMSIIDHFFSLGIEAPKSGLWGTSSIRENPQKQKVLRVRHYRRESQHSLRRRR